MIVMPRMPHRTRLGLAAITALIIFGFYSNFEPISICPVYILPGSDSEDALGEANKDAGQMDAADGFAQIEDESLIPHHPFDNHCKFPLSATYPFDLSNFRVGERLRQLKCPIKNYPLASQDNEGYLYIHNHFEHYENVTEGVNCSIIIIEGGIRDAETGRGMNDVNEVKTFAGIENKRLWVNADAYIVRCKANDSIVWEKSFAGIRDITKEKNTVTEAKDIPAFDNWGRKLKEGPKKAKKPDRYSIDILGFDSTARAMFVRHMPRTVDAMNKLGYHFFYGYNKIGDNSAINLGPILAGDLPEIENESKLDVSGDINADWLMPQHKQLDPTNIPFLWKMMKEKFGCRSMLNDDISSTFLGLFHYPMYEFLNGFTQSPADHFYRVYYVSIYKKWTYSQCKDGDQIQKEFLDLWFRFANQYKDICHFGFSFITTLTHDAGLTLEVLDEHVAGRLAQLHLTGRIEERMPLLAVKLPSDFARLYPKEYSNFLKNKYKLVSNFDVHQMLEDIVLMRIGQSEVSREGRGISLFAEIPKDRTCRDAYIAYNFCTCMIDRANVKPYNNREPKSNEERKQRSLEKIKEWIRDIEELSQCVHADSVKIEGEIETMGINPFVRHGFRTLTNLTNNAGVKDREAIADYFFHEMTVSATTLLEDKLMMLFRVEEHIINDAYKVVFEPFVQSATPNTCHRPSLTETCECLKKQT